MRKSYAVVVILLSIAILASASCSKAKETEGSKNTAVTQSINQSQNADKIMDSKQVTPSENKLQGTKSDSPSHIDQETESIPLITEVMTQEELRSYLKEKGILIIKKEDFKAPTLVWESSFDVPIGKISDLTEKGNCILLSQQQGSNLRAILFVGNEGNVRKKIEFKNIEGKEEHFLFVAMSGRYAADYKVESKKKRATFTYYDEEGNLLWSKVVSDVLWPDIHTTRVSYYGDIISLGKGNPYWSLEGEQVDVDLNINKVSFYNSQGKLLSEYTDFRNLSIGKLSDDGQYYAGIFWWSRGVDRSENRLVYIRTKDGKVMWERPFPEYWDIDVGGEDDKLAISEKGTYVAAAVLPDKEIGIDAEVRVFDKVGKLKARVDGPLFAIYEKGFVDAGKLADISRTKYLGRLFLPDSDKLELWDDPRYALNALRLKEEYPTYIAKNGLFLMMVNHQTGRIIVFKMAGETHGEK